MCTAALLGSADVIAGVGGSRLRTRPHDHSSTRPRQPAGCMILWTPRASTALSVNGRPLSTSHVLQTTLSRP
ncbi:unnamed protein product [Toxocara canis]|uniref:Secreted protein n=1 Tax=Toxocara canis TaxID=6265 RepID=A0A183UER2_TOXCA|nr:unnamed protein product [Toxocara canis]